MTRPDGVFFKYNSIWIRTKSQFEKVVTVGDSIIYWDLGAGTESPEYLEIPKERDLPVAIVKEKKPQPVKYIRNEKQPTEEEAPTAAKNTIQWKSDISCEKPRTPPVAAEIQIETIAAHGEIEDTFLNDDLTLLESNNSSMLSNHLHKKLFLNLPNFITSEPQQTTPASSARKHLKKRLSPRRKTSESARRRYLAPPNKRGLRLNSIIGFTGKWANQNMAWNPRSEFFAFTCGTVVCIEDLKTGKQRLLHDDHQEDITVLSLRQDCAHMAAAYPTIGHDAQVTIWDCATHKVLLRLYFCAVFRHI